VAKLRPEAIPMIRTRPEAGLSVPEAFPKTNFSGLKNYGPRPSQKPAFEKASEPKKPATKESMYTVQDQLNK